MKITLFASVLTFFVGICTVHSQNQTAKAPFKNGVEVNILLPIFPGKIFNAKYTRTLWQKNHLKGDVLIGFNTDLPVERETEGTFSEYSLLTGYRQFFFKGLFAELAQTTGYGRLTNHVTTAKDYNSFDWLITGTGGYKFEFGKSKRFYSILQVGMATVVYKSNPWPIYEDKTLKKDVGEQPFFYGGVQIGIHF
jgi:hypothetical protein